VSASHKLMPFMASVASTRGYDERRTQRYTSRAVLESILMLAVLRQAQDDMG
jgi:hypothetical protein